MVTKQLFIETAKQLAEKQKKENKPTPIGTIRMSIRKEGIFFMKIGI